MCVLPGLPNMQYHDGASIVFVSDREGEHPVLFLMAADGSQQTPPRIFQASEFLLPGMISRRQSDRIFGVESRRDSNS
jgi:hypothetical protein